MTRKSDRRIPGIRELKRSTFPGGLHVVPGDSIQLTYEQHPGDRQVVVSEKITKTYAFTEGVVFEADAGVFGPGRALGGAFVETGE